MSYAGLPESVRDELYHPLSEDEWTCVIRVLLVSLLHAFLTWSLYFNAVRPDTYIEALFLLVVGVFATGALLTAITFIYSIGPKNYCRFINACAAVVIWLIYAITYTNAMERSTAFVYVCLWYWFGFVAEWWIEPVYYLAMYMVMCTR
ncbi:hypothetical protein F5Y02DRAFT_419662 [Annulohypoxylon stygium]|nr:hypothetical protein F5Y02DRAFT_419662 [Annulohypoxylon stygium]